MSDQPSALEDALAGRPWALTGVIVGIDHIRDVNGRPLGERRAPADSRRDVPIELVPCPYHDERHGRPMNRPALEPTMRQFAAVGAQVESFHASLPAAPPSWPRMLSVVLDQFSAPARYLLLERRSEGPIPAQLAAGHKLAAGYLGALMTLLRERAAGAELPALSVESFSELVAARGSLIGASEVCAGPPHHIRMLTRRLVHGGDRDQAPAPGAAAEQPTGPTAVPPLRLALAQLLAEQVQLGLAWAVFDEFTERALLLEGDAPRPLICKTAFLADRLQGRASELLARPAPRTRGLASMVPERAFTGRLAVTLSTPQIDLPSASELGVMQHLFSHGDSAISLDDDARARMASRLANLLCRYRLLVQTQWHLEQALRGALGYPLDAGLALGSLLCPRPRSLEWLEVLTGHRVQCTPGPRTELTLRNHRRAVAFE
ncbi:MAG: hypothetical protein IPI49_13045 [Myxococcales bacterium]|nr:hypothetical protein [Myxococcales bacterium]